MEPFKIICVTCRARLTVRDESAIGQILACPKCGSMVQVPAPSVAAPSPGSAHGTKPRPDAKKGTDAAKPKAAHQPAPAPAVPSAPMPSAAVVAATRQPDVIGTAGEPPTDPGPFASAAFDDAAEMVAADVNDFASHSTDRAADVSGTGMSAWQFSAIAVGASAIGSALVAGAIILFGESAPTPTPGPIAASTIASAEPIPSGPPSADNMAEPSDTGVPRVDGANRETNNSSTAGDELPVPSPPVVGPELPADGNNAVAKSGVGASERTVVATPVQPKPEATEPAKGAENAPAVAATRESGEPKLRIDPLDVDPEGLDLTLLLRGPAEDSLAASDFGSQPPAPSADSPPPVPQPNVDDPVRPAARHPVQREALRPGEAAGDPSVLLARRMSEIHANDMQLVDLIDFATQLSGIPISVSAAQLRLAGVAATNKASCDAKDATIEQALTMALKPLRLAPVVAEGQIILKRIGDDKPRAVDYAVDDLAATEAEARKLASEFETLVFSADVAINVVGRNWHVTALESKQYEALILLERLRLARGLPPRSKYPASLLSGDGHFVAMADRLSAPTTFTFVEYTPLREVFRYWDAELDVPLLVDWPALAAVHLTPWTRIVAATANKSWSVSMDSVLEPLGLGWRAAESGAIEITTLDRLRADQHIDLYCLSRQAEAAAIDHALTHVRQLADGGPGPEESQQAGAEPAIAYDPAHRILIAKQSALVHRELADWLRREGLLAE